MWSRWLEKYVPDAEGALRKALPAFSCVWIREHCWRCHLSCVSKEKLVFGNLKRKEQGSLGGEINRCKRVNLGSGD